MRNDTIRVVTDHLKALKRHMDGIITALEKEHEENEWQAKQLLIKQRKVVKVFDVTNF
jgi:ribosomal protein L17